MVSLNAAFDQRVAQGQVRVEETALPAYFGDWLKLRRKELDLTQAELAQREQELQNAVDAARQHDTVKKAEEVFKAGQVEMINGMAMIRLQTAVGSDLTETDRVFKRAEALLTQHVLVSRERLSAALAAAPA